MGDHFWDCCAADLSPRLPPVLQRGREMAKQGSDQRQRDARKLWRSMSRALIEAFAIVAAACLPLAASAAERFLSFGYQQQHWLVQQNNTLGLYPAQPLLVDTALREPAAERAMEAADDASTETSAAFITTEQCGQRTAQRLVLCLDEALKLPAPEQLRALQFAGTPVRAHVRSRRAALYLRDVLAQRPERLTNTLIAEQDLASCAFACERIIVLEK